MEYKGFIRKERSTKKRILLFFGSLFLVGFNFMQGHYLYMVLAMLLCVLCAFQKEHVVSEEGVDIRYELLGFKHVHRWEWSDITAMRPDYKKSSEERIFLEIAKDVTIRAFIFTNDDAVAVMELAKRMNPEAYIDDRSEEERERYEQERDEAIEEQKRRYRQQKREAKARAKKNKKNKK